MDKFSVLAFTFAVMGWGLAAFVFIRLNNLEKKLKELDVIPKRKGAGFN